MLSNTADLQVFHTRVGSVNVLSAVAYAPGVTIAVTPWDLTPHEPCIVSLEWAPSSTRTNVSIAVVDPTQTLETVTLVVRGVELRGDVCGTWDPVAKTTSIVMKLPKDEWAGTAAEVKCQAPAVAP